MYDLEKRKKFNNVGELKKLLNDIDDNAKVNLCGDSYCWFHIEIDGCVINLDIEDLEDCYNEA